MAKEQHSWPPNLPQGTACVDNVNGYDEASEAGVKSSYAAKEQDYRREHLGVLKSSIRHVK